MIEVKNISKKYGSKAVVNKSLFKLSEERLLHLLDQMVQEKVQFLE